MPLDPQAAQLLKRMKEAGHPPLHTQTPQQARDVYKLTSPILDKADVPIGASKDRTIEGPGGPLPIRIYTPLDAAEGPLPALVFFHGGGFVIGNIDTHDVSSRLFSNASGFKVVSVDYRLAPEVKFPEPADDCFAATRWVAENAAEIGVDVDRIAVGGDSAGGNLAAVVCLDARGSGGPNIAHQLLIYPVTDTGIDTASRNDFAEGYFLEKAGMDWFHEQYTSNPEQWANPRCSPLRAESLEGLPPAYVITAGFDPLRDEGRMYAERLQEAGVPTTHVDYEGMVHGFWNMTGVIDMGVTAIEEAAAALKNAMAEEKVS